MARIAGVDIPRGKRIDVALTYLYGIGPAVSKQILSKVGVDSSIRVKDLKEEDVNRIREAIDKGQKVEGELRKEVSLNVKRLMEIGSYRGMRHRKSLPARGQRTKTNARTKRGARKTVAGRGQKRGTKK